MAILLALDLATNIGAACGEPGSTPRAWSYRLPSTGDDVGRFLDVFSDWLIYAINKEQPTDIYFEGAFIGMKTARKTALKLIGLCSVAELIAFRRKLPCFEASNSEVCKYFTGRARYPHPNKNVARRLKKEAVMSKCDRLGWKYTDDDAADAAALWCFAEHLLCPGLRNIADDLFAGAAA